MRNVLAERGTVSNRDFAMGIATRVDNYRGRKDSALALHYLWRIGDVMVTHRERFERIYALTEAVAPQRPDPRARRRRSRGLPDAQGDRIERPHADPLRGRLPPAQGATRRAHGVARPEARGWRS